MLSKLTRAPLLLIATVYLTYCGLATMAEAIGPASRFWGETGAPSIVDAVVYSQPPSSSGGLIQSSWWAPTESNYDRYVWDDFTLQSTLVITEIQWRGGFDPARFGSGGPASDFTVAIYPSTAGGTQPDVLNPPLVQYQTAGNAGQTFAGTFGGVAMYDYHFVLPTPFQATVATKYWVYIVASQSGIPDWGLSMGLGGDGKHFVKIHDMGYVYRIGTGDAAFTLLGPVQGSTNTPTATPTATSTSTSTATPTATSTATPTTAPNNSPTPTPSATPTSASSMAYCYLPLIIR